MNLHYMKRLLAAQQNQAEQRAVEDEKLLQELSEGAVGEAAGEPAMRQFRTMSKPAKVGGPVFHGHGRKKGKLWKKGQRATPEMMLRAKKAMRRKAGMDESNRARRSFTKSMAGRDIKFLAGLRIRRSDHLSRGARHLRRHYQMAAPQGGPGRWIEPSKKALISYHKKQMQLARKAREKEGKRIPGNIGEGSRWKLKLGQKGSKSGHYLRLLHSVSRTKAGKHAAMLTTAGKERRAMRGASKDRRYAHKAQATHALRKARTLRTQSESSAMRRFLTKAKKKRAARQALAADPVQASGSKKSLTQSAHRKLDAAGRVRRKFAKQADTPAKRQELLGLVRSMIDQSRRSSRQARRRKESVDEARSAARTAWKKAYRLARMGRRGSGGSWGDKTYVKALRNLAKATPRWTRGWGGVPGDMAVAQALKGRKSRS